MKPMASVASAPCTNSATLNIQPGQDARRGLREPENQPAAPMIAVPQSTAQ